MRYRLPLTVRQIPRRAWLCGLGAAALAPLGCATPAVAAAPVAATPSPGAADELAAIERGLGGRFGIFALNTAARGALAHRGEERFPMCSTFKLVLAAAILSRVDASSESLDRRLGYDASALLEYAPVTRQHLGEGSMTVEALCEAIVTVSDNTAANLLLETLGGPPGLTAFFRSLGDGVSRLDRNEPLLNLASPGDDRDTTTPAAMLGTLEKVLLGPALSSGARERLIGWMIASTTGLRRLRAGLPADFRTGDKTGTGQNGAAGDVAISWPPRSPPLLIAAYTAGSDASLEARETAFAEAARVVMRHLLAIRPSSEPVEARDTGDPPLR